ncbi:MAG: leucine-rich repeat domain-containing protein [Promethearchaeota archaeon]
MIRLNQTDKNDQFVEINNKKYNARYLGNGKGYSLEIINAGIKDLRDVHGLKDLEDLRYLDLSGNQIEDIPTFDSFRSLERIYLSRNNLKGKITLPRAKNLMSVAVEDNSISEIIIPHGVPNIFLIYAYRNEITIFPNLNELKHLRYA